MITTKNEPYGSLNDYHTGAAFRPATREQRDASREAARYDGGAGVILVDQRWRVVRADDPRASECVSCYVEE